MNFYSSAASCNLKGVKSFAYQAHIYDIYLREEGSENPVHQEKPQHSHHTPSTHSKRYLGHCVVAQVEPVKIINH